MTDNPVEPHDLAMLVEHFVDKEFADADRYDNKTVLDASGVYSLHRLVAKAYGQGWTDGYLVGDTAQRTAARRERDRPKDSQ